MNRGRFGRTLAVCTLAVCATVFNTGCIDRIFQNMLIGFGFSLGALPAQVVADQFLAGFLGGGDNTNDNGA
jgi:hypothetical protein